MPTVMKLTKGLISREEAIKINSDYVALAADRDWDKSDSVDPVFALLKVGQKILTYYEGQFVVGKVTSVRPINSCYEAMDGPIIRVSNGEYSWRVDGSYLAVPLPDGYRLHK